MNGQYILDGDGQPQSEPDLIKWGKWMGTANRILAKDTIGNVRVSTVFLGLDHSFGLECPLVLWETMIFGGEHDGYQDRYSTRSEAEEGHKVAVTKVNTPK